MSGSDEYRQHAAECMARAQRAKDEASRAAWLEMAHYWLQFSESAASGKREADPRQQIQSEQDKRD